MREEINLEDIEEFKNLSEIEKEYFKIMQEENEYMNLYLYNPSVLCILLQVFTCIMLFLSVFHN